MNWKIKNTLENVFVIVLAYRIIHLNYTSRNTVNNTYVKTQDYRGHRRQPRM